MKKALKKSISLFFATLILITNVCFVEATAVEIPTDYASAAAQLEECNYIIDGSSVYLFAEYEVGTGQTWRYVRRTSAQVDYVSHTVFTESGNNYIGDKAVIMFRFDATSSGIFRVALYMTQGGNVAVAPSCFNFVVVGDDANGYTFKTKFELSDKIPMDYAEAQSMGDLATDADLAIFCAPIGEDSWTASVSSTFTCEALMNIAIPKQSISEYALDTDAAGYNIFVLRITSSGSGSFIMTNSVSGEELVFPLKASTDDQGNIMVSDDRIVYGDVTGDGKINIVDATCVARYSVKSVELTDAQYKCAEVSGDGKVNIVDATYIARHSVKAIDKFPVEE